MIKNPPAMQETQIRSLGREGPLEKGMEIDAVKPEGWEAANLNEVLQ